MNVEHPEFEPAADEPAVRHPQLLAMVDAARREPVAPVRVSAEAVRTAWLRRRANRRRVAGLGLAIAASLALVISSPWSDREPSTSESATDASLIAEAEAELELELEPQPEVASDPKATEARPTPPAPVRLAQAIDVQPLEETGEVPEILGARRMRLPDGRWSIDAGDAEVVEVEAGLERIEIRGGLVHVEVAGDVARVEVLRQEVTHFDAKGKVADAPDTPRKSVPSASELSREAEEHLAAGRREEAIKSLRRLVTAHPRSAATPVALIDLGRLLERAGRTDGARCAYSVFLDKWPGHALTADVTRARRALGDGPECRGLRPRR